MYRFDAVLETVIWLKMIVLTFALLNSYLEGALYTFDR